MEPSAVEARAVDGASAGAAEHVRQYLESNGAAVDHPAVGKLIVLYTTGRSTGRLRRTPLRFFELETDLLVAASYRGSPRHPAWYLNLVADPNVWVRQDADVYPATAVQVADGERERLWDEVVVPQAPQFADYQEATDRTIPLVRLVRND